MKKKWLIALYKINEARRAEKNLLNQRFEYYLPKIIFKKANSFPKEEALFPGYIFINTSFDNYSALKYTVGIKDILKFGDSISFISDEDIKSMKMLEEKSRINPIASKLEIGQDVLISEGSLAGSIARVCSLPSKDRVNILLNLLGSLREVTIPKKDLIF